jgi:hypothetical protein
MSAAWVNGKQMDPDRMWRQAEDAAICTCGLRAVGYRASWVIEHAPRCFVSEVYRALVAEGARELGREP